MLSTLQHYNTLSITTLSVSQHSQYYNTFNTLNITTLSTLTSHTHTHCTFYNFNTLTSFTSVTLYFTILFIHQTKYSSLSYCFSVLLSNLCLLHNTSVSLVYSLKNYYIENVCSNFYSLCSYCCS